MPRIYERRSFPAPLVVFDLVDGYLRQQPGSPEERLGAPIAFTLVRRVVAGADQAYDPPLRLRVCRSESGYYIFFGQLLLADSTVINLRPAGETYVVRIERPGFQPVERELALPGAQLLQRFELQPAPDYPFPQARPGLPALLRGCLRGADLAPLAGVTVKAVGLPVSCVADWAGQWLLAFPAAPVGGGDVVVRTYLPGQPAVDQVAWIKRGIEAMLGPTVLYGTLRDAGGAGVLGATVRAAGLARTAQTNAAGEWRLEFPNDQATADLLLHFTPAGEPARTSRARVYAGQATELRQAALRGQALDAAGNPLPGVAISVEGQPSAVSSDRAGRWWYYFPIGQALPQVQVVATSPGGQQLVREGVPVVEHATVVVDTFRFD